MNSLLFFQDFAMRYWRDNGTPVEKLRMGFATYGRTFRLTSTDTGVGAPASGPASAGTYTREAGFWSYYEVGDLEKPFCLNGIYSFIFKSAYRTISTSNTLNVFIDLWLPRGNNNPVD